LHSFADLYGLTHTSGEAAQLVGYVVGEVRIPCELRDLILQHPQEPVPVPKLAVAVVEISTFRQAELGRYVLHRWCVKEQVLDKYQMSWDGDHLVGGNGGAPPLVGGIHRRFLDVNDINRDLSVLRRLLGCPLLVVSHFNADFAPFGNPGRSRRRDVLLALLRSCRVEGVRVVDPSLLLPADLAQALVSPTHYSDDFVPVVGEWLRAEAAQIIKDGAE